MTSKPPFEPPVSPEPVLAWRVWRLARKGSGLTLVAITRPDVWPAQKAMRARCDSHRAPIPRFGCTCGLYAAATPDDLAQAGVAAWNVSVVGAVAMWGTIVEHANGSRAQFAYPARLRLACTTCLSSGRGAVEPAFVVARGEDLVAYCRRHLSPVPAGALAAAQVQAELLSTYAVELLPVERVHEALRRTAPPRAARPTNPPLTPARLLELAAIGAIRVLGFLISAFMFLWVIGAVLAFVGGVIGVAIDLFNGPDPSPSVSFPIASPPVDTFRMSAPAGGAAGFEPHHRVVPPELPAVGIVCGTQEGRAIELVPCRTHGEVLLGFAQQSPPRGAQHDCFSVWDAYSRGDDFSVCWMGLPRFGFVHPWATSLDPFTVPKEEGGLLDGDR